MIINISLQPIKYYYVYLSPALLLTFSAPASALTSKLVAQLRFPTMRGGAAPEITAPSEV
jgi:hypothetical protein